MIQALEKIPTSGQYEEVIFDVPWSWNGESWNFVLFTTSDSQEWCGHFRWFWSNHLLVAELSNKNIACVISGSHWYLINIDKKEKIKDISSYPISWIISDEISSSFIVSTFYDITQINEEWEEIDLILPDQADWIVLKEYKNRKINLEIEFICASERFNNDYYIDLDEMTIKKHNQY